jgi:hypothetical protein
MAELAEICCKYMKHKLSGVQLMIYEVLHLQDCIKYKYQVVN